MVPVAAAAANDCLTPGQVLCWVVFGVIVNMVVAAAVAKHTASHQLRPMLTVAVSSTADSLCVKLRNAGLGPAKIVEVSYQQGGSCRTEASYQPKPGSTVLHRRECLLKACDVAPGDYSYVRYLSNASAETGIAGAVLAHDREAVLLRFERAADMPRDHTWSAWLVDAKAKLVGVVLLVQYADCTGTIHPTFKYQFPVVDMYSPDAQLRV
jgi:hypothetical protein